MAAGENESEGSSMGSSVGGSLSLAEPVACAGSSAPLLCSDAILGREGQQSEQLCVVCHYFPLSRALLPCRHTCICAICFCEYLNYFAWMGKWTKLCVIFYHVLRKAQPKIINQVIVHNSEKQSTVGAKFLTVKSHKMMTCRLASNSPKKRSKQNRWNSFPPPWCSSEVKNKCLSSTSRHEDARSFSHSSQIC